MQVGKVAPLIARADPSLAPYFLVGQTGIGKTRSIQQAARISGRVLLDTPPLTTMLPEDAGGIPVPNADHTSVEFLPPSYWNRVTSNTLIFLDELNLARPDVQSALASVLCALASGNRRVGSLIIPQGTLVVAAGMPPTPGSPARPLPAFLRSRLRIIHVEASSEDWIEWAVPAGIDPAVVAFIRRRPDLLAPDPPQDREVNPFPTPRGWETLSRSIQIEAHTGEYAVQVAVATVGAGAATEFVAFRDAMGAIPDPLEVITGELPFPEDADVAVATASLVAQYLLENLPRMGDSEAQDLTREYLRNSLDWPTELVVAFQLNAFSRIPVAERSRVGMDPRFWAEENPEWLDKFVGLFEQIAGITCTT